MSRIIDLTVALDESLRGVSVESIKTVEQDGWNATTLHLYSHCGTHMDAPVHFGVTEQTIDRIPLEKLMGPAWVVDLSAVEPRALIQTSHVAPVADKVRPGDGLLLRTDWSRRLRDPSYRNALPRVSNELAEWCVQKGVRLLGVEPPSVADVHNMDEVTAVHRTLLGGGVIVVEGLANLDQIRAERVTFMAFPLKVAGGDGAPVRALAIED
jgi:kynurenine formamidase